MKLYQDVSRFDAGGIMHKLRVMPDGLEGNGTVEYFHNKYRHFRVGPGAFGKRRELVATGRQLFEARIKELESEGYVKYVPEWIRSAAVAMVELDKVGKKPDLPGMERMK